MKVADILRARLAGCYFTSHGPATLRDFAWWSGLSITEGKRALELVKNDLESATIGEELFWFSPSMPLPKEKRSSVFLLPAFDEYVIAYADRTALVTDESKKKNLFDNGLFRNVILINGKAAGNWKRVIGKNKVEIELNYFKKPAKSIEPLVKKAMKAYERFITQKASAD